MSNAMNAPLTRAEALDEIFLTDDTTVYGVVSGAGIDPDAATSLVTVVNVSTGYATQVDAANIDTAATGARQTQRRFDRARYHGVFTGGTV